MIEDYEPPEPKPLEGKLVQIHTGPGIYSKTFSGRSKSQTNLLVDDQYGQVIGWAADRECYVVQTFEGQTVLLDESNLEVCALTRAEEGGADIVYPIGGSPEELGKAITDWLAFKGFCMVQMSESKETRRYAADTIAEVGTEVQDAFRQELESAYLGANNITKVSSLPPENDAADAGSDEDALGVIRQQMLAALNAAGLFSKETFGHSCWATTNIWARESSDLEDVEEAPALNGRDVTESSYIEAYDRFIQGRKLCALYLVANSGGEIKLWPRLGSDISALQFGAGAVTLPVSANKMLIFRHDQMSYSYQPKGPSVALQSWMLSDIPLAQNNLKAAALTGVKAPPPGQNAQIMMLDSRMPGAALGNEKLWLMFASGTDTDCHWPVTRWETEPYYTTGDDWALIGKSYTNHGAFMNEDHMLAFDNEFFDINSIEASVMCPGQRHTLETCYGCLYKSGHTRSTLQGENIGFYWGDVGMDWHAFANPWSYMKHAQFSWEKADTTTLMLAMQVGVTASRVSHTFGITGPVQSADTACSASLVALQAGHKAMMHLATDANMDGSISAPHSILGGGVNTLMTPWSFVGNCAASMLSHVGRCWTFDRTADGYQRGEGCGSIFLKWSADPVDIEERMACLVGSCSGHDGRSASLTAPNGPAQQDAIRRSMRMAGVDPSLISVCECHGTGTALGDPIEIGSLQGVMRGMRTFPLLNTSAKTNISHLEAGAGGAGIMKCIQMVAHSCGPPNCHLRQVNANLITNGYPVFFQQELCDCTFSTTFIGVSSFGFGGTNSRADVYGRSLVGARNTGNVWTEERLESRALAYSYGLRNSYKGFAKLDKSTVPKIPVSIMGSWNNFQFEEMEMQEPGYFTYRITLGHLRHEYFQLCLGTDRNRIICPCTDMAGAEAAIAGPAGDPMYSANMWVIDGRCDAQPVGATYFIEFKWQGEKSLSWTPITTQEFGVTSWCVMEDIVWIVPEPDPRQTSRDAIGRKTRGDIVNGIEKMVNGNRWLELEESPKSDSEAWILIDGKATGISKSFLAPATKQAIVDKTGESSSYSICGSWNRYHPQTMTSMYEKDGSHEAEITIDMTGEAKFQILRGSDNSQMIYPDENEKLCGPDKYGGGRYFIILGAAGETMKVKIWNINARIDVHVISDKGQEACWTGAHAKLYYVSGSFNSWGNTLMSKDNFLSGVYKLSVTVLDEEPVEYKIFYDDDLSQELKGVSAVLPQADAEVVDAVRDFQGDVGTIWEIILDLNQDDPNRMIYHRRATHVERHKVALALPSM